MSIKHLLLPLSSLPRIGPAITKNLSYLVGGNKIFNLALHQPTNFERISICPRLFEVQNDELIIIKAKVESHNKPFSNRQPYKVICYTPSGYVNLIFFKIFPSQIQKMPIGDEIAILGRLQKLNGENQIVHPQEILPADRINELPQTNITYPLTAGITSKFLRQKITAILSKLDKKNNEWINEKLVQKENWPDFFDAIKQLQNPKSEDDFSPERKFRKRLVYDEVLAWQLAVLLAKTEGKESKKFTNPKENLAQKFLKQLPFEPTKSQLKAIAEIEAEIFSNKKMLRLLQGDVGSGKTIVAIASALQTTSQNKQACVIAPTTVLAKQHFSYFQKFLENFDLKIDLLTSATTKKQKEKLLEKLSTQECDILISTHAALEDDVKFKNLGLAVIDEQHRFGVMQRLKLVEKGEDVDTLLMSATPIPRSLMMGLYGDMDVSILAEKPKNRQEIETLIMSQKKSDEIHDAIKRAISKGEKIYWICPAIEEAEENEEKEKPFSSTFQIDPNDLTSAKEKYKELVKIFGEEKVALLHGKMKEKDKEKVMADFSNAESEIKILCSTTVVEVGVDVSDATVMIIENAENFGLAQLHQLRGRVGRSDKKSFCILLYGKKFGENGRKRLNILRESNDGFFIAEEDLKMRGSGELLGTKQSGFPEFKIANLNFDSELLKIAHKNAKLILSEDAKLEKDESEKYRNLLKLFSYDECLRLPASG